MPILVWRRLGRQPYEPVWAAMKAFTAARDADTPDELWLVEHPPVYTQGLNGKPEHLLNPGDIPVIPVDRGGQVTYHGPGQIVVYCLLDLTRAELGIRDLVSTLEQAVVELLAALGISAVARPEAPGVYVSNRKIASLGLRVRRGRSYHGLSLNVAMDLEPFSRINPCGYPGLAVTQLAELLPAVDRDAVATRLLGILGTRLGRAQHRETHDLPSIASQVSAHV